MKWTLNDLMPLCIVPHCPKFGTRHLLPHQAEISKQILQGNENYIYWQGAVGSAKTVLYAAIAAAYIITIPESYAILFRKNYGDNYKTLWKYFKASIKAACEQGILIADYNKIFTTKRQGDYTFCTLPNGSIAEAGQTKDWSAYMGPSYDLIVVSDAMENNNFGEIFHGEGVVGGLQSRLRGQHSSFFKLANGQYKDMRRFLIESNTPPNVNELHRLFGKEPGVRDLTNTPDAITGKNITYRHIQTTTLQNDHNPPSYYQEISSTHNDPNDVLRILEGKTVPYYGGKPVIQTFIHEIHVQDITVDIELPLFCSLDLAYQHHGAIFAQIKKCDYNRNHFMVLSEISNLFNMTTWDFVENNNNDKLGLLYHLALFYPDFFDIDAYIQVRESLLEKQESLNSQYFDYDILKDHFRKIRFCIDKANNSKQKGNKDAKSDRLILESEYGISTKFKTNIGREQSLDRTRRIFKESCICSLPVILIDKKCVLLTDALQGGYRFSKKRDGSYSDEPIEDHLYEDVVDPLRYALENFFWSTALDAELQQIQYEIQPEYPWSWMERGIRK